METRILRRSVGCGHIAGLQVTRPFFARPRRRWERSISMSLHMILTLLAMLLVVTSFIWPAQHILAAAVLVLAVANLVGR